MHEKNTLSNQKKDDTYPGIKNNSTSSIKTLTYLPDFTVDNLYYPRAAKNLGQQGTVWLCVELDETGSVLMTTVLSSSGFPVLDRAARETASGWDYSKLVDQTANRYRVTTKLTYKLQGD
jgi:TonB family protein